MKLCDLSFLTGCIIVAPHADFLIAVPSGLCFMAVGLWLAWRAK